MKQFELIFVDLHYSKPQNYFQWVLKKIQKGSNAPILQKLVFFFSRASVYVLAAHKSIPSGTERTGFRKTV